MSDESQNNANKNSDIDQLLEVMARLRNPETGCPWDVEQTFKTIAPYTIEEAYEVADAIEHGDMNGLKDELGDLLLQVVFHARMAEEDGAFDFDAVAQGVTEKMLRRHPHVFGDARVDTAEAQTYTWEEQKAAERASKAATNGENLSALDGVAVGLPALTRAVKLQKRAARVGFDWPKVLQVFDKIDEEVAELKHEIVTNGSHDRLEDELGDLLFGLVNLARHLDVDPESALRHTNAKFERRFHRIEETLAAEGRHPAEASLEDLEAAWQAAKATER